MRVFVCVWGGRASQDEKGYDKGQEERSMSERVCVCEREIKGEREDKKWCVWA